MTFLIIILVLAIQVFLTIKKMSPFLSLLIVAIIAGLLLGIQPIKLIKSIETGVGNTLGGLTLIIFLGAILGKILAISGAAEQISTTLIKKFGAKNIQWAILITGFFIGIPLFYNAGFIILVPLVFALAKKTNLSILFIAIPMAASLSVTHCFLPPHPGPIILIKAFNANIGKVLLYGLVIAITAVIIAGPFLAQFYKNTNIKVSNFFLVEEENQYNKKLPTIFTSFSIALLPVLLITLSVLANHFLLESSLIKTIILFIGDTTIALLIAVLLAIYFFGLRQNYPMEKIMQWLNDSISGIAMIVLIITAGGVFKQVLQDSGTADYITSFSSKWQMSPLFFAWLITALIRVTIGSATVSAITAAGIVSPIVISGVASPELMVLAVGAGSVFGSHINDSGFWMFKEFFGLSLKQTFLS